MHLSGKLPYDSYRSNSHTLHKVGEQSDVVLYDLRNAFYIHIFTLFPHAVFSAFLV